MKCQKCKTELKLNHSEKENLDFYFCKTCGIGGKGKDEKTASKNFMKNYENIIKNEPIKNENHQLTIPKNKNELLKWSNENMTELLTRSATFIDKPATKRMIEKNIRYAMKADLKGAWDTVDGQESIIDALTEAFEMGATLPEMGSIIPFGKTVELIPSINAFEFALTSGKNPPFKDIKIDAIYKNDQFEISRKNGNFSFELTKISFPRGEIIAIIVQATETETGNIIGEAFDEKRLMEKAERHSTSYKYYLSDMRALSEAKTNGKNFIEKWNKKFYENDIQNPYVGADKPEMLKKIAGKSFFRPFMKIRNARSFEEEWKDEDKNYDETKIEKVIDNILDEALTQVKDAEIVIEKKEENGKENKLFDE